MTIKHYIFNIIFIISLIVILFWVYQETGFITTGVIGLMYLTTLGLLHWKVSVDGMLQPALELVKDLSAALDYLNNQNKVFTHKINKLEAQLKNKKYKEALNSGDGVYRP